MITSLAITKQDNPVQNTLNISMIKLSDSQQLHEQALCAALRPHLSWVTVPSELYYTLSSRLPAGVRLVLDHTPDGEVLTSTPAALARAAAIQTRRQDASPKTKKPAKKKGLSARQRAELATLQKELEGEA